MKSWKTPTPEQVDRAVAKLSHEQHYRYFFDKLQNPEWIQPLRERKFFRTPPAAKREPDGFTLPPWPESMYLARVAGDSPDPELVLQVLRDIPTTDNTRVRLDLVEAALKLPPKLAVTLTDRFCSFPSSMGPMILPSRLADFAVHLATGGEGRASLRLMSALLAVHVLERNLNRLGSSRAMVAHFDDWEYGDILRTHGTSLADACGLAFLGLLAELLAQCLRGDDDRYSYIWRPAVEDHEQNLDGQDVRDHLITAVRDTATRLLETGTSAMDPIIRLLEQRQLSTFQRIALHLLRRYPDAAASTLESYLLNRELFSAAPLQHEYALLLRERVGAIPDESFAQLLQYLDFGPVIDPEAKDDASAEELQRILQRWTLRRLLLMRERLPAERLSQFEKLNASLGLPEHPEFSSYHHTLSGPQSPKSHKELSAMSVESLRSFLTDWDPPDDEYFGEAHEGLSRVLSAVVSEEPERFSEGAEVFVGASAPYVHAIISGLQGAVRAGSVISWPPVIILCEWAVGQEDRSRARSTSMEPNWSWVHRAVADLLREGLKKSEVEPPPALRSAIWRVLAVLATNPSPSAAEEVERNSEYNAITLAINTTRGVAVEAIIEFASWVQRQSEVAPRTLSNVPEAKEAIERLLDPDVEPTRAIRALLGRAFPRFVYLDRAWAEAISDGIFTRDALGKAAWHAYLAFCSAFDDVFRILRRVYDEAMAGLRETDLDGPFEHLAHHLVTFYWRGTLGDAPTDALGSFYAAAPPPLRGEVIEFIGRSLQHTNEAVADSVLSRIRALWEWRVTEADALPLPEASAELAPFAWWLPAEGTRTHFPPSWLMEQALRVLRLGIYLDPSHLPMEYFGTAAVEMPRDAVEAVRLLIENDRHNWSMVLWKDSVRTVLEIAIQSGDDRAIEAAAALIDKLGRRGFHEYKDLHRAT